jgi:L-amino acid N-acyltransferase YncA
MTNVIVAIRPYKDSDLPDIERMGQQTVDDGKVFPFRNLRGVKDYWFAGKIFVATLQDRVVGSYVIKPVMPDRMGHIANAGYMVDVGARGLKVGNALAVHSIQTCATLGYRGMQFNAVVSTNYSAIHLWKKNGFAQIGKIPDGFQRDDGYVDITIWYRAISEADVKVK